MHAKAIMMIKSFLLLLSALPTESFVVAPMWRSPTTLKAKATFFVLKDSTTSTAASTNDDALAQLQHEYKILQEKLLCDVVIKHDEEEEEMVEEQMIDIAIKATKIHEDKQMEIMRQAESTRSEAVDARKRIQADAASLDPNERNPEMEAVYNELVAYSDFADLAARTKIQAAKFLLEHLKENEKRLQATLEALKEEQKKNTALEKEIHTHHRSFLDKVKDAIYAHPDILISLDPHIL